jgi:hypothetical protein
MIEKCTVVSFLTIEKGSFKMEGPKYIDLLVRKKLLHSS